MQRRTVFGVLALLVLVSAAGAAGIVVGIDSQAVGAGGTAVIPVKVTGAAGVGGLDLTITYDTAALKFVKAEAGPLAANGMIEANEVQPGTVNIGIVDSQGINGNGNVILLTFTVLGAQGTSSQMDVVVRGAFGTDLKNVANQAAGGTITVGPAGSGSGGKPALSPAPLLAVLAMAAVAVIRVTGRR
jgi:hypothetical protein